MDEEELASLGIDWLYEHYFKENEIIWTPELVTYLKNYTEDKIKAFVSARMIECSVIVTTSKLGND